MENPKRPYFLLIFLALEWLIFFVTIISWSLVFFGPRGHMPTVEAFLFMSSVFGVWITAVINLIYLAIVSRQGMKLRSRVLFVNLAIVPAIVSYLLIGDW